MNWFIILLIVYGVPLAPLRYRFRCAVYKQTGWKMHLMPWFVKETIALFSNRYFTTPAQTRVGWIYRIYLGVYVVLILMYFLVYL
ncbi:MAG: hypothetical protein ACMXYC_04890 [Candidatus Woesearchaeota archaeon]